MRKRSCLIALVAAGAVALIAAPASAMKTTVQGTLRLSGQPQTGQYEFRMSLWDAPVGGTLLSVPELVLPVQVRGGQYEFQVDSFFDVFTNISLSGGTCFVQTEVRLFGDPDFYDVLTRVPVDPSPFAARAVVAEGARSTFTVTNLGDETSGVRMTAVGSGAVGAPGPSRLKVSNLGSSGEDGVSIDLPDPNSAVRLGPSGDCAILIDPNGPPGLTLLDPICIRVRTPGNVFPPIIYWGPTNDCSIGLNPDPLFPGLTESDPNGFRLLGQNGIGCRLIFGPNNDCRIEIDPFGPTGLLLRDPTGVRLLGRPESSPGAGDGGPTVLRFGDRDDCRIEIDPLGPPGLTLRDPCVRIFPLPDPTGIPRPPWIYFGPTQDCVIGTDPSTGGGLTLGDPGGIVVDPLIPGIDPCIFLGPSRLCKIATNPNFGMRFDDPNGFFFNSQADTQFVGTVFAPSFVQTSSARYKDNIEQFEDAIDIVKQLRGVSFDWKELNEGKSDIGFIAEEVAKVLPELVAIRDGQAEGVAYNRMTVVTVEAIKAQQKQIEAQQAEIDRLSEQVEALLAHLQNK